MPNQRGHGQTLVAFPADERLLEKMDRARGSKSRSALVREALRHYLKEVHGIEVPESLILPPDRAGKGGRSKSPLPPPPPHASQLNDAPSGDPLPPRKPANYRQGTKTPKKKPK